MARYNEILVGRFARAVQKLFGMKGEVPVGSLAGELHVVHIFQSGAENRYLEGFERFGIVVDAPAVAANQSGVQFRNPVNSNVTMVFEKLLFETFVANEKVSIYLGPTSADLASLAVVGGRLDARGRPHHTMIPSFQNTTPTITTIGAQIAQYSGTVANFSQEVIWTDIQELTLLPGDALLVLSNTVNAELTVSALWRERFLEESERA